MSESDECYSLVLNSQTSSTLNSSSLNAYQYYVNWNFLPTIYNRYNVRFSFTTVPDLLDGVAGVSNALLGIDFGGSQTYNEKGGKSIILGKLSQSGSYVVTNTPNMTIFANWCDNAPVTISRPTNNILTVNINDINANSTVAIQHYYLKLTFTPIKSETFLLKDLKALLINSA